jgi:hypothetical protein
MVYTYLLKCHYINLLKNKVFTHRNTLRFFLYSSNLKIVLRFLTVILVILENKGNNKITELRTILQRESQNS